MLATSFSCCYHLNMCCRYYIDKDDAELAEIIEAAGKSSLAERFVVELSKPMKTNGEIRLRMSCR